MKAICGDNRYEIIAKVKEHLLESTNIDMHPEELLQVDNILFRLWQLDYFNLEAIPNLKEENNHLRERLNKETEVLQGLMRFCRCFAQNHLEDCRYTEAVQFLKGE